MLFRSAPAKTDRGYHIWDAENSMVMAWLVNAMNEDIGGNYMCYQTAKELWDSVHQMYSDLTNDSQVYELELQLGETKQGGNSVTKYFSIMKGLWQDLDMFDDYVWKCPDDCKHYQKTIEHNRIFKFLAGLNMDLDDVR